MDGDRCFVRLTTRSPKDAILVDDDLMDQYVIKELTKVEDFENANEVTIAIWFSMLKALVVKNGKEALNLFMKSDRVREDCRREIGREEDYDMTVIIRKWVDIPCQLEVRGFVTNRNLNALTQYYDNCFLEELVDRKNELEEKIFRCWEEIKDLLPFENAIVDFCLDENDNAILLEINPFDTFTGSGLFCYIQDWEVITGRAKFEFRVIEDVNDKHLSCLSGIFSTFGPEIKKAIELKEKNKKEGNCTTF